MTLVEKQLSFQQQYPINDDLELPVIEVGSDKPKKLGQKPNKQKRKKR